MSELEKRLEHEQAKPIDVIVIDGKGISFIADGYSRSIAYGMTTKRRIHKVNNLAEAWEKYKDCIGYNPYSTQEEKTAKFSFIAKNLKTIFDIAQSDMVNAISDLLGLSKVTVRKYLSDKYKVVSKQRNLRKEVSQNETLHIKDGKGNKTKYKIIYADPPWRYEDSLELENEGSILHYDVMSLEELKGLPVPDISDKDSILFLWVTMPKLKEGLELIEAWGFKYKTCGFCWVKLNPVSKTIFKGIGRWVMGNAELCLLATKGNPHRIAKNVSQIVMAARGKHSEKPDEVRNRILKLMGDIPRIELFARNEVEGWDCIGYKANGKDVRSMEND